MTCESPVLECRQLSPGARFPVLTLSLPSVTGFCGEGVFTHTGGRVAVLGMGQFFIALLSDLFARALSVWPLKSPFPVDFCRHLKPGASQDRFTAIFSKSHCVIPDRVERKAQGLSGAFLTRGFA